MTTPASPGVPAPLDLDAGRLVGGFMVDPGGNIGTHRAYSRMR